MRINRFLVNLTLFFLVLSLAPSAAWCDGENKKKPAIEVLSWSYSASEDPENVEIILAAPPEEIPPDQAEAIGLGPAVLTLALYGEDGKLLTDPDMPPKLELVPGTRTLGTFAIRTECPSGSDCTAYAESDLSPRQELFDLVPDNNGRAKVTAVIDCEGACGPRTRGFGRVIVISSVNGQKTISTQTVHFLSSHPTPPVF
jgi:hypothetical protein